MLFSQGLVTKKGIVFITNILPQATFYQLFDKLVDLSTHMWKQIKGVQTQNVNRQKELQVLSTLAFIDTLGLQRVNIHNTERYKPVCFVFEKARAPRHFLHVNDTLRGSF